jgi:hypothetical protein
MESFRLTRRWALICLSGAVAAPFVIRNAGMLMPVRNRLLWRKKSLSGSNFTAWARLKQRLELLGALLLIVARHSSFLKAIFNKSEYDLAYFCNSVSDGHGSPVAVVLAFRCREAEAGKSLWPAAWARLCQPRASKTRVIRKGFASIV